MGGRDTYDYDRLTSDEEDAIRLCFDKGVKRIENVSPKLAATLRPQREAYVKWAGVAKATFPETKSYSYPGTAGGLGVDWITPELYNYAVTPSGTYPCYASYTKSATVNSFDISMTAGTKVYVAGAGTTSTMYKGSPIDQQHSFVVIAQDGLIEVPQGGQESLGASATCLRPVFNHLIFKTQLQSKYSPIAMSPLICETLEENKSVFQFNTPGMIPMDHNVGTEISLVPNATEASTSIHTIIPLGLVFYEYDFMTSTSIPRT